MQQDRSARARGAAGAGGGPAPRDGALDGLRGLAVVAVVTYHLGVGRLPGGFAGVDLFFAISGFLVCRQLAGEVLTTGRVDLPAFWRRRARRLLPPLVVLLAVVALASLGQREQWATLRGATLSSLLFAANWWFALADLPYFADAGRPSALQHLWSLGVEGQFYLVWPVVVALVLLPGAWRRHRRPSVRRLVQVAVVLAAVSCAAMAVGAVVGDVPYDDDGSRLYYATTTHAGALLLGAAAGALAAAGRVPATRGARRAADAAGVAALAGFLAFLVAGSSADPWTYRWGFALLAAAGAALVVAATLPGGLLHRLLDVAPLRALGVRAYSLYLWHWPVVVLTPWLDAAPAAVAVAVRVLGVAVLSEVSYRVVERRRGRTWEEARAWVLRPRGGLPVAVGVAVALLATALLPTTTAPARTAAAPLPAGPVPTGAVPGEHPVTAVDVFGDSVLLGAWPTIATAFPGGDVDAVEGRQPSRILTDLSDRAGALAPTVVLQVGNNGAVDPDALRSTVRRLAAHHRVLLLTVAVDRPWRGEVNDAVGDAADGLPTVAVVRWDELAGRHPGWFYPDGLHVDPAGARGLTDALLDASRTTPLPVTGAR